MEKIPSRISESFVKVSYALWVVDKGAVSVTVSVDGAERNPELVADTLISRGYTREPLLSLHRKTEIVVISQPGPDISAYFPDKSMLVAECKGEPTPSAVRSGSDRTAFYTAVGQLIITTGSLQYLPQQLVVVMADTKRLRALVSDTAHNGLLRQLGLSFALVNRSGEISEIQIL